MRIVLASKSPRRQELLKKIVDNFDIKAAVKPEVIPKHCFTINVPKHIAKQKALEVFENNKDAIVIGADTVVIAKKQILGKPKDVEDAKRMMLMLSNYTHKVVTGVYIISKNKAVSFKSVTKVTFRKISDEELKEYLKLDTIYDKAGAYAIQAEAGPFVTNYKGEYDNVVGLPTIKLKKYLDKFLED